MVDAKGPRYRRSKVEKNDEVTQVPPEVFAASAKWDIKWGHLHSQLVPRLDLCLFVLFSEKRAAGLDGSMWVHVI